eukprot:15538174-Heterocapsa_arctica.AAC.1
MEKELKSHEQFHAQSWVPESAADGHPIISSRWLLKKGPDDVKARIIVQEVHDGTPRDSYAATPTSMGRRLLMALATRNQWSIQLGDVSTAFLHAPIDELIFVRPPANLQREGQLWQLHKALYGLRRA